MLQFFEDIYDREEVKQFVSSYFEALNQIDPRDKEGSKARLEPCSGQLSDGLSDAPGRRRTSLLAVRGLQQAVLSGKPAEQAAAVGGFAARGNSSEKALTSQENGGMITPVHNLR